MEIIYPKSIRMANTPTPLTPLKNLSERFGFEILVKREDMTGCALSGNKIRKLEFIMADVLNKGADC